MKKPYPNTTFIYLIAWFWQATATWLSAMVDGQIGHDKITKFLSKADYTSKDLWLLVKDTTVRQIETDDGILAFDDTIEEKYYIDQKRLYLFLVFVVAVSASASLFFVENMDSVFEMQQHPISSKYPLLLFIPVLLYVCIVLFMLLIVRAFKPLKSYKENGLLRTFIFGFVFVFGFTLGLCIEMLFALYVGMLYAFLAAFIFGILPGYSIK